MDQFTRRYLTGLAVVAVIAVFWWSSGSDHRVGEINEALSLDPHLASYPYQFRVSAIEGGVAKVSSPRSAELSVIHGLRIMFPELETASPVSDRMQIAQADLARHQALAARRIKAHPEVSDVEWVLDTVWLQRNGVYPSALSP